MKINEMTNAYLNALVENVDKKKMPKEFDVIIGGGALNGFYGIGTVLYIRRLCKNKNIHIQRVSGTSIGSLLAAALLSNSMETTMNIDADFYSIQEGLRAGKRLENSRQLIRDNIIRFYPDNKYPEPETLFITYWDNTQGKVITKSKYSSTEEVIDTILRSSHIPFISNNEARYQERYCDGVFPYMFTDKSRQTLYISLSSPNKRMRAIMIRENNSIHRVMSGILDASTFFVEGKSDMCSWIDKWSTYDCICFSTGGIIRHIIYLMLELGINFYSIIPNNVKQSSTFQGIVHAITFLVDEYFHRVTQD